MKIKLLGGEKTTPKTSGNLLYLTQSINNFSGNRDFSAQIERLKSDIKDPDVQPYLIAIREVSQQSDSYYRVYISSFNGTDCLRHTVIQWTKNHVIKNAIQFDADKQFNYGPAKDSLKLLQTHLNREHLGYQGAKLAL